jgi:hypothetical protein
MYYDVWFVGVGSVCLHLLIPLYDYFASLACFYWFWYMFIPVFFCPTLPLFPCICWSVVVHTLYAVTLVIVLLPVLGILVFCVLLSHQSVGEVCLCYLSLCSIFLLHNILFVTLSLVLWKEKENSKEEEKKEENCMLLRELFLYDSGRPFHLHYLISAYIYCNCINKWISCWHKSWAQSVTWDHIQWSVILKSWEFTCVKLRSE